VLLVTGEPGIGKSHLLETSLASGSRGAGLDTRIERLRVRIDTAVCPVGRCVASCRSGAAAAIFGNADHGDRAHFFEGLSELLAARLERHPVVLCFDDVHWSDESSAPRCTS
jgi:hypothetical protein